MWIWISSGRPSPRISLPFCLSLSPRWLNWKSDQAKESPAHEHSRNLLRHPRRLRRRIGRARDLPPHHHVVRPVADGLGRRGHALLIALRRTARAHSRCDQNRLRTGLRAAGGGLQRRTNQPVHPSRQGFAHAQRNQVGDGAVVAHVGKILLVEAGEHRHGQQFRGGITAALNRRAHHLAAAVDGQKAHAAARCHAHGTLHRLADVVIFLVQEDIFSLPQQFAHEVHAGRRVKLHPDFIEADLRAQSGNQRARFGGGIHVQCNNDAVLSHISLIGFACRGSTRPIPYASGYAPASAAASASGNVMSKPPDVCGSESRSSTSDGRSRAVSTTHEAYSRLFFSPPGIAPSRAYSSAPSRNRKRSTSISSVTPLASAISRACPISPKPVTSVHPCTSYASIASHALRLSVSIEAMDPATSPSRAMPRFRAVEITPVPSRLVNISASPARAPAFAFTRAGWMVPVTAYPNLISSSAMLWPPTTAQSASRIFSAPPFRISSKSSRSPFAG